MKKIIIIAITLVSFSSQANVIVESIDGPSPDGSLCRNFSNDIKCLFSLTTSSPVIVLLNEEVELSPETVSLHVLADLESGETEATQAIADHLGVTTQELQDLVIEKYNK